MAVLHVVSGSAWASPSLQECLSRIRKADAIMLLGDGVYAALGGSESTRKLGAALGDGIEGYCLREDLETRGISALPLAEGMQIVDYGGFVDLAARFSRICTW